MTKAAELAEKLSRLEGEKGIELIEASTEGALYFDVIDEAMCIMHSDGSVNIVDNVGKGAVTVESISPGNILKVLKHYRPFTAVFKGRIQ